MVTGGTTSGLCAGWEGAELCIAFLLLSCNFLHSFSQCPNFPQYLHLLSLLDHLLSCFFVLNVAAATLTFALTSASLSHVANLSRLLLRVLLDQVRSKNGKLFCIRLQGHLTRYEPGVPCPLAHFQGHRQFHCKLQLTDKISQYIHSQILLSFAHS